MGVIELVFGVAFIIGLCYGIKCLFCWAVVTVFEKGEKVARRAKIDITEKGRNRNNLRIEMASFIKEHDGVEYVYIELTGACEENNYIGYATEFITYDKKHLKYSFNFREHGYDCVDSNAAYDIFERLSEQFDCHWHPCYKEIALDYYEGGFVSDAGKIGYVNASASTKKVLLNIALYSDEQWKYHVEQILGLNTSKSNKRVSDSK